MCPCALPKGLAEVFHTGILTAKRLPIVLHLFYGDGLTYFNISCTQEIRKHYIMKMI